MTPFEEVDLEISLSRNILRARDHYYATSYEESRFFSKEFRRFWPGQSLARPESGLARLPAWFKASGSLPEPLGGSRSLPEAPGGLPEAS